MPRQRETAVRIWIGQPRSPIAVQLRAKRSTQKEESRTFVFDLLVPMRRSKWVPSP